MCFIALSCKQKEESLVDVKFDPETMPSMVTDSVVTLISDSGITRYKLIADKWQIFDKAKDPFWFFPNGIYLEQFDEDYDVESTIYADTAWNFTDKKLWRLKGNVEVTNIDGDEFRSDELFWDQADARVYSDEYIEIKKGELELKGYGFNSNQQMTKYTIFRPHDGKLPIEENETVPSETDSTEMIMTGRVEADEVKSDSLRLQ